MSSKYSKCEIRPTVCQILTDLDQVWVAFGQIVARFGRIRPSLALFDQLVADV